MKKYEVYMDLTVTVTVDVHAENEEQAKKKAMAGVDANESYFISKYDSLIEREVTEVNECEPEDDDPLKDYSEDYRNGIAYVMENLDEDDKAIIRAECNKAYKQHLIPDCNIVDDSKVTDLLEEYGQENDLPEGWYLEEYDASEILTMI